MTHTPDTARNVVAAFHGHVREALDDTGGRAYVEQSLQRILSQGTGATRQRQAYRRNGSLADVVAHAIDATHREPADHPREEQLV